MPIGSRGRREEGEGLRRLTPRETEIARLVAGGLRNREIADRLSISIKTVETHRANIMNKLALRTMADLIRYAIRKGLITV